MAVRPFKFYFATADQLLAADLPQLGAIVLVHLNSYEDRVKQQGKINRDYFLAMLENRNVGLGPLPQAPEYGDRQPAVTKRLMKAWDSLEAEQMLTHAHELGPWYEITDRGQQLLRDFEQSPPWSSGNAGASQEGSGLKIDLSSLLQSSPLPTAEEIAGPVLEEFVNYRRDDTPGNFASRYLPRWSPADTQTAESRAVFEAFGWLQTHNLIAPSNQAGWYFVTAKGREIGTAEALKHHLASQESAADIAYESAKRDLDEMRKRAESDISNATREAKEHAEAVRTSAIEDAKIRAAAIEREAASILQLARETAQGVSLNDVQTQFANAAKSCLTNIWIWAGLSIAAIGSFILVVVQFFTKWQPKFQDALNRVTAPGTAPMIPAGFTIYHTVLRVTVLTAIAAIATFCLKVLRAQLHLREQNLHRQRVANSMAAFLGAASQEQRDLILGRMVDAITAFGPTGLLTDDDSMSPARVILESVPRALSTSSKG